MKIKIYFYWSFPLIAVKQIPKQIIQQTKPDKISILHIANQPNTDDSYKTYHSASFQQLSGFNAGSSHFKAAHSKIHCASLCLQVQSCDAFLFTEEDKQCRMTTKDTSKSLLPALAPLKSWLVVVFRKND